MTLDDPPLERRNDFKVYVLLIIGGFWRKRRYVFSGTPRRKDLTPLGAFSPHSAGISQ